MPLPHMPDAVVFDMDGLLLDTETLYSVAITDTCRDLGFEMTDAMFRAMVGSPLDANRTLLLAAFGPAFPFEAYLSGYRSRFARLAENGIQPRPGAADLIRYLRETDMPMAVATSTGRTTAMRHLHDAGFLDDLRTVVTRDDVVHGKPHPEVFLTAAARLGAAPGRCLALEDSHNGVRSAATAGMMTIMVPDMLPATPEMEQLCVHIAADLHAVRAMLQAR